MLHECVWWVQSLAMLINVSLNFGISHKIQEFFSDNLQDSTVIDSVSNVLQKSTSGYISNLVNVNIEQIITSSSI